MRAVILRHIIVYYSYEEHAFLKEGPPVPDRIRPLPVTHVTQMLLFWVPTVWLVFLWIMKWATNI